VKITIITPTVMRTSLWKLCNTIEEGSHKDWEHIVVVDDYHMDIPYGLEDDRRIWLCSQHRYRAHGNPCRAMAYWYVTGDIITYADDDNYYINDALAVLNAGVEEASWGVFPMLREGNRFLNPCVGDCCTDNNQIFHKPVIKGIEIRYIPYDIPSADGKMAEGLSRLSKPLIMDTVPELLVMEEALHGLRPGEEEGTIWGEKK